MSEELDLGEDTKKALLAGIAKSKWAFTIRSVLTEVFTMDFHGYQKIEEEVRKNWRRIVMLIKDVAKSTGVLDVVEHDIIWIFPKGLDDEVIKFLTGLRLDADAKARVVRFITEGFSLWKTLQELSFPFNAFALFLEKLGESFGVFDVGDVSASVSYGNWVATFEKKYVMKLPPREGYLGYYMILKGTLENKELEVSVPLYDDGYRGSASVEPMISAFEYLTLEKLVGLLEGATGGKLPGTLLFYMLSEGETSFDMNKKKMVVKAEVYKEDFRNIVCCPKIALYRILRGIHPCYTLPVVLTGSDETFMLISEIFPSPTKDPASKVLAYLSMYSIEGGSFEGAVVEFLLESLFDRTLGVGDPKALGLACMLFL